MQLRFPLCRLLFAGTSLSGGGGLTGRPHTVLTILDNTCIVIAFPLPSFQRPCGVGKGRGIKAGTVGTELNPSPAPW